VEPGTEFQTPGKEEAVVEPGRYEAAAGVSPSRQATHNRVRVSC
jgi:hypothetical protein